MRSKVGGPSHTLGMRDRVVGDCHGGVGENPFEERPAAPFKEPLNRSPRYLHSLGCFDLTQPLVIAEAHCLELVDPYRVKGELAHRNARRLEDSLSLQKTALPLLSIPRHRLNAAMTHMVMLVAIMAPAAPATVSMSLLPRMMMAGSLGRHELRGVALGESFECV